MRSLVHSATNLVLLFLVLFVASVIPIWAQAPVPVPFLEYSAKFLCGTATSSNSDVRPGTYATSINIHNPNTGVQAAKTPEGTTYEAAQADLPIIFLKKVVVSVPAESEIIPPKPNTILATHRNNLPGDKTEYVDCAHIRRWLKPSVTAPQFIEGFVVILVPVDGQQAARPELDVVAVYTVEPEATSIPVAGPNRPTTMKVHPAVSLQVVQVPFRRIK